MKPLFMWAGGKTKMLKHYAPLFPVGAVSVYSEPFFGGGAMFVEVMKRYAPRRVFLNDINSGIMGIYKSIKSDCAEFESVLDSYSAKYLPLSKEDRKKFFYDLRQENAFDYSKWSFVYEHAVLYFLMKTAFNGIWQINKNTNGRFGTPSGLLNHTNEVYNKANVREWNAAMNSCECILSSDDWSAVPMGDFTFFDPPYRDSFADYNESFPDDELVRIIKIVESTPHAWLCNRDCGDGFFDDTTARVFKFPVTYTAGRRKRTENGYAAKKATEILLLK
jgi:DNA adenine methylase